jgi:ferredoxin
MNTLEGGIFMRRTFLAAMNEEHTGLIIEEDKCIGCGICVVVCEENRMNEEVIYGKGGRYKDELVLAVEGGIARLVDTKKCKRTFEPPEFCRACVDHCPTGAIALANSGQPISGLTR